MPLVAQHSRTEQNSNVVPSMGACNLKTQQTFQGLLSCVPLAEFESATFCSASKRSIQLRYRGMEIQYTGSGLNIPQGGQIVKEEA